MSSFDKDFEKANILYNNEEYDAALEIYNNLYHNNFDESKILPRIIYSYLSKGDFNELVKYFERFTELQLDDEEIDKFLNTSFKIFDSLGLTDFSLYINKAQFLIKFERFDESLIYLNKSLKLRPKDILALNLKAFVLYNICDYENSLKFFNKTIRLDNLNYDAWKFKAQILYMLNEDEKSMKAFQKTLSIDNSDLLIWREFISSCIFSGHLKKAVTEVNKALKLFPSNLDLLLDKFDLYMFKDNSKQAKKVADEIAEKYPDIVDDYLNKKNDLLNDDLISFIVEDKPYHNNDYILENDFIDDKKVDEEDFDEEDFEKFFLNLFENASIFIGKKNKLNFNLNDILNLFLFTDSDVNTYKKDLLLNKLSVKDNFKLVNKNGNDIEDYVLFYETNLRNLENKALNDESLYDEYKDEFLFKTIFDSYNKKYGNDVVTNIILKANLLFTYKKYINVFGYLTEADKLLPKNINVLLLKSGDLLFLEEYEDALKYANMALVLDKFNFIGWVFKAYAHLYLKDIFNTLQSFNVALTLNKMDKNLWRLYELTLMSIGSYNLGLNINKQALTIFPDDTDFWSDRLFMLSEIKDTESEDYIKSLEYGKNSKFFNEDIILEDYIDMDYLVNLIDSLFIKFEVL